LLLLLMLCAAAVPKALDRYAEIADALVLGGNTREEKVRPAPCCCVDVRFRIALRFAKCCMRGVQIIVVAGAGLGNQQRNQAGCCTLLLCNLSTAFRRCCCCLLYLLAAGDQAD
jgi:hypothetical protein